MEDIHSEEIQESINELIAYQFRLTQEVINIGKKLKLSEHKIEETLAQHSELKEIKLILHKLTKQIDVKN
tara:strand:- start:619 stop:828 length:210 start_codon:yes stop_codon:yes gene_type:complete